jgi:hypothetical protein
MSTTTRRAPDLNHLVGNRSMAEVKRQYHDRETMAMARFISRRAVEDEIKRQGLKLREFSFKQIVERADDYLLEHTDDVMREVHTRLLEQEVVAALRHFAQIRKARKSRASVVQISGAK